MQFWSNLCWYPQLEFSGSTLRLLLLQPWKSTKNSTSLAQERMTEVKREEKKSPLMWWNIVLAERTLTGSFHCSIEEGAARIPEGWPHAWELFYLLEKQGVSPKNSWVQSDEVLHHQFQLGSGALLFSCQLWHIISTSCNYFYEDYSHDGM